MYIDKSKKDVSEIPVEDLLKEIIYLSSEIFGLAFTSLMDFDKDELFAVVKFLIGAYEAKKRREEYY
ncbi:hypothetical protein [Fervidobacterium sp. 2310opik-2]|uniref:hypothetical protein n=1 Tax=Fervidobacterium sp. 2310opik-2 TaxID=1755815 RepID=UPI0013E05D7F|nr:hypothetical protein [Fervidobacterium sp. 2310opik-2]KAF2961043.1 hypothetical protein AS161_03450 [Fervidobacterium sp. 2310opik-2]